MSERRFSKIATIVIAIVAVIAVVEGVFIIASNLPRQGHIEIVDYDQFPNPYVHGARVEAFDITYTNTGDDAATATIEVTLTTEMGYTYTMSLGPLTLAAHQTTTGTWNILLPDLDNSQVVFTDAKVIRQRGG